MWRSLREGIAHLCRRRLEFRHAARRRAAQPPSRSAGAPPPSRPRKRRRRPPRRLLPLLMPRIRALRHVVHARAQATQDAAGRRGAAAAPVARHPRRRPPPRLSQSLPPPPPRPPPPLPPPRRVAAAADADAAEERAAALAALADGRCDRSVASPHFAGQPGRVGRRRQRVARRAASEQYFDVRAEGGGGFERVAMSVTAWVRPAGPEGVGERLIQTVASSKSSGCESSAQHRLRRLRQRVEHKLEQLYASWGNGASGCEELATSNGAVKAASGRTSLRSSTRAPCASGHASSQPTRPARGGYRRIVGGRSVERPLSSHSVRVGMHPDGLHGLVGQLDEVAVACALTAADVEHERADGSRCRSSAPPPLAVEDGGSGGGSAAAARSRRPWARGAPRAVGDSHRVRRNSRRARPARADGGRGGGEGGARAQSLANLERISGIGANDGMAGTTLSRRAGPPRPPSA